MNKDIYQPYLTYIANYWNQIILKPQRFKLGNRILQRVVMRIPKKNYNIIDVPNTCLVPNTSFYRYIFYWDSYFMFRGLLGTSKEWVIPEMVDNFIYIFNKYHIIPNFSHPEALGRSQAPFLTSMIFDAYRVLHTNHNISYQLQKPQHLIVNKKLWLKKRIKIAIQEYQDVWESPMDADHQHYNHKVADYNLNRYGDRDVGYGHHAEQESGWDMTSRFYNRCDDFLPVDLNCFLYKYEIDFARAAEIFGNMEEKTMWEEKAAKRKDRINTYMWSEAKGFYFDYDYIHKTQSHFVSLAGFVPLWTGIATRTQAQRVIEKLSLFQTKFGLAITDKASLPPKIDTSKVAEPFKITIDEVLKPKQWDYPNIWPPLHYLTVIGLLRYDFVNEAKKLMQEYLDANMQAFDKYGAMLEKMDGLTGDMPPKYWYPTQLGFGWTNAIFYRYINILDELENNTAIFKEPLPATPPYALNFIH
ncbi:MAG TPA: trehalase family glycosidase [Patescibacteria group bacterium]|nr:trehalase family glycosidase [Patescibacteria group bacterium]